MPVGDGFKADFSIGGALEVLELLFKVRYSHLGVALELVLGLWMRDEG